MQKLKQILAIIGIILLVGLYALTLVAAIFDSTATMQYLSAAIAATILIPVTLWLLNLMIKAVSDKKKED
jgi:cell shape-determining protein MreD